MFKTSLYFLDAVLLIECSVLVLMRAPTLLLALIIGLERIKGWRGIGSEVVDCRRKCRLAC